jgi:FkbM family methyltransferase
MLISISRLRSFWLIKPTGVLHVGAHLGEELDGYENNCFGPVTWIEAQPELVRLLSERVNSPSKVISALVWSRSGVRKVLNLTNNGQSSSVFNLGSHALSYPDIVVSGSLEMETSRLDDLLGGDVHDFLNLDIQGAEYEALEGLGSRIEQFNFVYTEVNRGQVYEGIKQVREIDEFLRGKGFQRVATVWTSEDWGDSLYLRIDWALAKYGSNLKLRWKILLFQMYLAATRFTFRRIFSWVLSRSIKIISQLIKIIRKRLPDST